MANPEQLKILKQGVKVWNTWRNEHSNEAIDLSCAKFKDAELMGVNLAEANLERADFRSADLDFSNLTGANLRSADLTDAHLIRAHLSYARLNLAICSDTNLTGANMTASKLGGAILDRTNFDEADLTGADLTGAHLRKTFFNQVDLTNADLSWVEIDEIAFNNVNLSKVIGLESAKHYSPSSVGIDTVYKSQGKIPDKFLQDAGVPEEMINIARSIRNGPPIQWFSCFISYSTKDDKFARRLHSRMREANMRVWFGPEDLKGGKKLHEQLFEAIQSHDRLLIVLSEHSIQSEWVMTEIRKARETEKKEKRRKLFPIRLTNFETLRDWTCFDADNGKDLAVEVREYAMPNDFSNWKNHDAFESAFARLKKDLEAENFKK